MRDGSALVKEQDAAKNQWSHVARNYTGQVELVASLPHPKTIAYSARMHPGGGLVVTVTDIIHRIHPPDDSSFDFSPLRGSTYFITPGLSSGIAVNGAPLSSRSLSEQQLHLQGLQAARPR
jgi:hypothetical protein